jgi:hypothetical protein
MHILRSRTYVCKTHVRNMWAAHLTHMKRRSKIHVNLLRERYVTRVCSVCENVCENILREPYMKHMGNIEMLSGRIAPGLRHV